MDVRKVQDMRKNVEHQYITEDSKTRIYLSVVREFNEKEYEEYSKKKKRAKIKKRIRFLKRSMVYIVPTAVSLIFFGWTSYISSMVMGLRAECHNTSILMAHYTVPGCNMESGQTSFFTNFEPVIPREALEAAGYEAVLEAYKIWCVKAVSTERYSCLGYDDDIGAEMEDAMKEEDDTAVELAIERTIEEALMVNPRTESVEDFWYLFWYLSGL